MLIGVAWVSPTRVIYTIAQRQRDNVTPTPTGEIFAIDRDGGSARQLYGYRAGQSTLDTHMQTRQASYATPVLLQVPRKDPNHVLIAEYPWRNAGNVWYSNPDAKPLISRLDIYSGKKQQLDMAPLARAQLLLDFDDNVRLAYGENEFHKPSVSWKPEPGSAWTSFALEGFRDETVIPGRFSTDNRSVFLTGAREGEAFDALYRLDLQTRALEKVHAFEDASVDELITDFADREIVGVSSYTARRNDYWLAKDNPTAQTYQALQRAFPQQRIRVTSNSDDGRLVIVLVDSDVKPGELVFQQSGHHRKCNHAASRVAAAIHNASSTAICGTPLTWTAATAIRRLPLLTP